MNLKVTFLVGMFIVMGCSEDEHRERGIEAKAALASEASGPGEPEDDSYDSNEQCKQTRIPNASCPKGQPYTDGKAVCRLSDDQGRPGSPPIYHITCQCSSKHDQTCTIPGPKIQKFTCNYTKFLDDLLPKESYSPKKTCTDELARADNANYSSLCKTTCKKTKSLFSETQVRPMKLKRCCILDAEEQEIDNP